MRVLLFSGTHPRHLYIHETLLRNVDVCGFVCMQREDVIPVVPEGTSDHDAANFARHFRDRKTAEEKYFGDRDPKKVFSDKPVHYCSKEGFNTSEVAAFVAAQKPDVVLIFGTGLVKEPVFSSLPQDKVNLHLGLSPWYRGAATLFWPFYNMQPQWAGATIHQIVPMADAGAVIHQSVPVLERGDGIHDVSCKVILQAADDLVALLREREKRGHFIETRQTSTGRLYKQSDFKPEHLRVIYDLFDNAMVDAYLDGTISQELPPVIRAV